MKTTQCLIAVLVASCWASAAFAQAKVLRPIKIDTSYGVGGASGGDFSTRSTTPDFYNNAPTGPLAYPFYYEGVHVAGELLFLEKQGQNDFGYPVGPVASPAKISVIEFYIYANDPNLLPGDPVDCTITFKMFDHCIDFMPALSTCAPSGDDSVAQASLGFFYVDLTGSFFAPTNGDLCGFTLDLGSAGLPWTVTDGSCFIDMRCMDFNGGDPPVAVSAVVYPAFNGVNTECDYAPGGYPITGYSADNYYSDTSLDGTFQRADLTFAGIADSPPFVSNLMIRLAGDDGCTWDHNGDGFVNGDDIDYIADLIDDGCPY